VSQEAEDLAGFLDGVLGLPKKDLGNHGLLEGPDFAGAVFPTGEGSWIEVWPELEGMPAGFLLQIVVDDADAWAERARKAGVEPQGPTDAHGERIYFFQAPAGLPITVQSALPAGS
jgi:hypothetical protein